MANTDRKIILTKLNLENMKPAGLFAVYENDKAVRMELFYQDEQYELGNIYVAHVNDIVKNINAAFVEYAPGRKGYLSLEEYGKNVFFINKKNTSKICEGDNILIQVKKEPIKTKDAVVSTCIELTGQYVVLTYGKPGISVSAKITDITTKTQLHQLGESFVSSIDFDKERYPFFTEEIFISVLQSTGIIFRTECSSADNIPSNAIIRLELARLFDEMLHLFHKALCSKGRTLLKEAQNPIISMTIEALKKADVSSEVITDCKELYDLLSDNNINARFYLDQLLPLYKLYSVESVLNEITSKKIWLKSGGYLIIEYTEAMTVIDVNTGKCEQGKNKENTLLKINLEAGEEALRQLRLRNISGIIIIDFIDMKEETSRYQLMKHLKNIAAKDEIRTSVIDMTRLNLVEITRKKTRERITIKK